MHFFNYAKAFTVLSLYTAALQDEAGRFVEFVRDEAGQFAEFARDEAGRFKLVFEERCDHAKEAFDDFLDSTVLPNVKRFVDDVIKSRSRQWQPSPAPSILLLPPPPPPPPVPPGTHTTPLYIVSGTTLVEQTGYPLRREYKPLLLPPPAAARKATDKDTFNSHSFQSVKPSPLYGSAAFFLLVFFTLVFGVSQTSSILSRRPRRRTKSKSRKSKSRSRSRSRSKFISRSVLRMYDMSYTPMSSSPLLDFVYMQSAITIHHDVLAYTCQRAYKLSRGFPGSEPEYISEGDAALPGSSQQSNMDRKSVLSLTESSGSTSVHGPVVTPEQVESIAPAVHQPSATNQAPPTHQYSAFLSDSGSRGKNAFFEIDPASVPLPEPLDDELEIGPPQDTALQPAVIDAPSPTIPPAPNVSETSALPVAIDAGARLPSAGQPAGTADDTGVPVSAPVPESGEVDPCLVPLPGDDSELETSSYSDAASISLASGSVPESIPRTVEGSSCSVSPQRVSSNDDLEASWNVLCELDPASVPLPDPDEDEQATLSSESLHVLPGSSSIAPSVPIAKITNDADSMSLAPVPINTTEAEMSPSLTIDSFGDSLSATEMQEVKVHAYGQEVRPAIHLDPSTIPLPSDDSGLALEAAAQSSVITDADDTTLVTEVAIPEAESKPAFQTSLSQIFPLPLPSVSFGIDPANIPLPEALDDELGGDIFGSSHPYAIANCDNPNVPLETTAMPNETGIVATSPSAETPRDTELVPQPVPLSPSDQPAPSLGCMIEESREVSSKGECFEVDPANVPLPEASEDEVAIGIVDFPCPPATLYCDGTIVETTEQTDIGSDSIAHFPPAEQPSSCHALSNGSLFEESSSQMVSFEIDPANVPLPDPLEDEFGTGISDSKLLHPASSCDAWAENAAAPGAMKGIAASLDETGRLSPAFEHLGPLEDNVRSIGSEAGSCFTPLPGSDSDVEITNNSDDKEPGSTPGFEAPVVPEHPAVSNTEILCAVTDRLPRTIVQETRTRMSESDVSSVEDNAGIPRAEPDTMQKVELDEVITLNADGKSSNSKDSSVGTDTEPGVADAKGPADDAGDNNGHALPIDDSIHFCRDGQTERGIAPSGLDASSNHVRKESENSLGSGVTPWAVRKAEKIHITSRGTGASIWAPHAHDAVEQSPKQKDVSLNDASQEMLHDALKSSLNIGTVIDLRGKTSSKRRRNKVESSKPRKGNREGTRAHLRSSSTPDTVRNTTEETLASSSHSPGMHGASERTESRLSNHGHRSSSSSTLGTAKRAGSRPSTPQYEPFRFGSFSRRERHGAQESAPVKLSHRSTCTACLSKTCQSTHEPARSDGA